MFGEKMSEELYRKYLNLLSENYSSDTIIFIEVGNFYEAYNSHSTIVNGMLGTPITTRFLHGDKTLPVPTAGIVYHEFETSKNKLIESGYTVVVA